MAFRTTRDAAEHDQPTETEVEAEIREFTPRRRDQPRAPAGERKRDDGHRTTTTSVQEIDKLITELQTLSDTLHSEQQEIVQYSTLTRAALQSTKTIAKSLTQFRKAPDAPALQAGYPHPLEIAPSAQGRRAICLPSCRQDARGW